MNRNVVHIIIIILFLPFCALGQLSLKALILTPQTSIQTPQNPWLTKKIDLNTVPKSNSHVLTVRQHYLPKHIEGFFCKAEDRANRKVAMPIRFRLGSLDYVDRLEGKYIKI